MAGTRVLITGSRSWDCEDFAERVVRALVKKHGGDLVVVHGAARGVDLSFAAACDVVGVRQESHRADWDRHGKAAGARRNQEMVDAGADLCLAFHPDLPHSKGTRDCVLRALAAGIPTWWIGGEGFPPVRQRAPR